MSNIFDRIDSRSVRLSAAVTAALLVGAVALGPVNGLALVAVTTFLLAIGSILGWRVFPLAMFFRRFVRPRIGPGTTFMSARAVRFEQGLGMGITLVALLAGIMGASWLYYALVGAVAAAALVEAILGRCLGCKLFERLAQHAQAPASSRTRDDATVG